MIGRTDSAGLSIKQKNALPVSADSSKFKSQDPSTLLRRKF